MRQQEAKQLLQRVDQLLVIPPDRPYEGQPHNRFSPQRLIAVVHCVNAEKVWRVRQQCARREVQQPVGARQNVHGFRIRPIIQPSRRPNCIW